MAARRMLSQAVACSDKFLDLSFAARALYVQMNLNADDDGFLGAPKKEIRACGCGEDALSELEQNGFVILFETGVCVLTHWRVNNYIRPDRYHETVHTKEKARLTLGEDLVYQMDTEVRLGEVRQGKVRLGEVRQDAGAAEGSGDAARGKQQSAHSTCPPQQNPRTDKQNTHSNRQNAHANNREPRHTQNQAQQTEQLPPIKTQPPEHTGQPASSQGQRSCQPKDTHAEKQTAPLSAPNAPFYNQTAGPQCTQKEPKSTGAPPQQTAAGQAAKSTPAANQSAPAAACCAATPRQSTPFHNQTASASQKTRPTPDGKSRAPAPEKRAYGEYGNVLLTDEERNKFAAQFADSTARIETLSRKMAMHGYRYQNHYAALMDWAAQDEKGGMHAQQSRASPPPKQSRYDYEKIERITMANVAKAAARAQAEKETAATDEKDDKDGKAALFS